MNKHILWVLAVLAIIVGGGVGSGCGGSSGGSTGTNTTGSSTTTTGSDTTGSTSGGTVQGRAVLGSTGVASLVTFGTGNPQTAAATLKVTGLQGSDNIDAIAIRPSTHGLYGICTFGALYKIDATTGAATRIGPADDAKAEQVTAIAFDPVGGKLRVVGTKGGAAFNVLVDPDSGLVAETDTAFATPSGSASNDVSGIAYTASGDLYAVGNLGHIYKAPTPSSGVLVGYAGSAAKVGGLGLSISKDGTTAITGDVDADHNVFIDVTDLATGATQASAAAGAYPGLAFLDAATN